MLINYLGRIMMLIFWGVVFTAPWLAIPLTWRLVILGCGVLSLGIHWIQAKLITRACAAYLDVTTKDVYRILVFGVFALKPIKQRLAQLQTQNASPKT